MNFSNVKYLLWTQCTGITKTNTSEQVVQQVIRQIWGQVGDQTRFQIFNEEKAILKKRDDKWTLIA